MKQLLIALLFMGTAAHAWTPSGDKIHFQKDSAYLSVLNNGNDLCLAADGNYYGTISKCVETRGRADICVKEVEMTISQPVNSTRTVCLEERGRSGQCVKYGTVAYNQSPNRTITWEADRGYGSRTETVRVPDCN